MLCLFGIGILCTRILSADGPTHVPTDRLGLSSLAVFLAKQHLVGELPIPRELIQEEMPHHLAAAMQERLRDLN